MASENSSEKAEPSAARAALDNVSDARTRLAERMRSPWWYHPGMGASVGFALASPSIDREIVPYGVILGLLLIPMALTALLRRSTGIGVDHYMATPGTRKLSMVYSLMLVVLIAIGAVLQWGMDLRWGMAGCGVAVLALTAVTGRRIEEALRRDVRAGV